MLLSRSFFYITILLALTSAGLINNAYGQTGTAKQPPPGEHQVLPQSAQKDSVTYIDPKTGKPKVFATQRPEKGTATRKPDTIIYIDNGNPRSTPQPGRTVKQVDTVIVLKKGKQKTVLQEAGKRKDTIKIQRVQEHCQCMSIKLKAPDTLHVDDYVNYSFILKNNCKELLWVNSSSFSFFVFNPDGSPARVLRKLQYVKQFKYPEFVQVSPGEEYTFDFADDPFFQYELRPYWKYRFTFAYLNSTKKYRGAPNKTYLCREFKDKTIAIADKPRLRK